MSKNHPPLTVPSQAYKRATLSLVYKLSGVTFGSLLAAYSLGFISLIAAQKAESASIGLLRVVLLSMQYASISITFAYLTASFYLTYHTAILTMPKKELEGLGVDFSLAILQALCFGFSMLYPWSFPILLGINFLLTGIRQRELQIALARTLHQTICEKSDGTFWPNFQDFRRRLNSLLDKDFSELSGWRPMGKKIRWFSIAVTVVGIAIAYLVVKFLPPNWILRNKWIWRTDSDVGQFVITGEVIGATVLITMYGWGVLKRSATFLEFPTGSDMDEEKSVEAQVSFRVPLWRHLISDHAQMTIKSHVSDNDNVKGVNDLAPKIDIQFDRLQQKLQELNL